MDQDLTFKANFSDEGLGKLKEAINEKLREFMGDYTDDTLVEYVIVLLRNGRKKDDTAKELHVFLGNDNIPFISWLWDHLSANINLYIEQPEQNSNLQKDPQDDKGQIAKRLKRDTQMKADTEIGAEKRKRQKIVWEEREKKEERESRQKILWEEREKKEERERRQKIVWEEREKKEEREREKNRLPVRSMVSSVISSVHEGDYNNINNNNYNNNNNNGSRTSRTRYQQNVTEQTKRPNQLDVASRRLLQFAVRDAVLSPRTQQQQQPVFSRLRSVLASRSAHNQEENQELNKEEDEEIEEEMEEEVEEEIVDAAYNRTRSTVTPPAGGRIRSVVASRSVQRVEEEGGYGRGGSGVTAPAGSVFDRLGKGGMVISRGEMEEDCVSDNERYDDRMVDEYSSVQQEKLPEKKQIPASQIANKPSKILNISVNVNTWKPAGTSVETSQSHQFSLQNTPKSDQTKVLVPENIQRETPKAVSIPVANNYKAPQTLEDTETRTLFVSNVHFAATKDALSRHFNKFGAVLKVIILIDPSTGQPTGSAYVEFLQKESAEAALSLNGTSFMSRILKVVRRNSSDATQMVPGYHPRTSSFPSRGQPSRRPAQLTPVLLRGGKPRNMQWKRGGTGTGTGANQPVPVQSPGARSFTYTRVPQKTE